MPAAIPLIAAIVGIAGTGFSVYEAVKGPSGSGGADPAAAQAQALKDKQAQQQQELQMLRRAAPNAQAATGGSLTDAGFASLVANLAGLPGDVNLAETLLKGGNTPGTPLNPGGTDLVPGGPGASNVLPFNLTPSSSSGAPNSKPPGEAPFGNLQEVIDYLNGGPASQHVAA
jgi:hypothetical protein